MFGILVRQRPRMHAGHEEAGDREQADDGVADERQSRSLVPGPSASNGAPSFQRVPVTALPRSTTRGAVGNLLADHANEILEPLDRCRRTPAG